MSRVAPEVIFRPDARREVIESEGARGTYCRIAYVVLFSIVGQSSKFPLFKVDFEMFSHGLMCKTKHRRWLYWE